MKYYTFLIFTLFYMFKCYSQSDLENKIKNDFKINYDLKILEDPISVRNLFLKNQNFISDYVRFASSQNRSWYFNYFNLNSMRRLGWNSYVELYDNRFLTWNKWREDLILPFGNYEWFKPVSRFFVGLDVSESLQYALNLSNENLYVKRQLQLLGVDAIELADVGDTTTGKNLNLSRDDILTVLTKKGMKYKIVSHPGRKKSSLNNGYNIKRINEYDNSQYKLKNNRSLNSSNSYFSQGNGSNNIVQTITRSVVSVGGSTSANASNSSGGNSTSVVTSERKQ